MRYSDLLQSIAVLSALSIAGPAAAADFPITGSWRGPHVGSCAAVKEGSAEDFFKISKKKIVRYEGECEIIGETTEGYHHELRILCETEGETARDTIKIEVITRDQIDIEGAGRYDRCK